MFCVLWIYTQTYKLNVCGHILFPFLLYCITNVESLIMAHKLLQYPVWGLAEGRSQSSPVPVPITCHLMLCGTSTTRYICPFDF